MTLRSCHMSAFSFISRSCFDSRIICLTHFAINATSMTVMPDMIAGKAAKKCSNACFFLLFYVFYFVVDVAFSIFEKSPTHRVYKHQ